MVCAGGVAWCVQGALPSLTWEQLLYAADTADGNKARAHVQRCEGSHGIQQAILARQLF
jgi:hypothetical protein